jgi:hypothetical protein
MSSPIPAIDLTQRPPRSMRQRLGGFVLLPRILDKGRAKLAKKNGEYNYNSPTDQHLLRFLGLDLEALLKELAEGKGDGEILEWVLANAKTPRAPWEIEAWSACMERRSPDSDAETLTGFAEYVGQHSKTREDIKSWFDALDLDDHVLIGFASCPWQSRPGWRSFTSRLRRDEGRNRHPGQALGIIARGTRNSRQCRGTGSCRH